MKFFDAIDFIVIPVIPVNPVNFVTQNDGIPTLFKVKEFQMAPDDKFFKSTAYKNTPAVNRTRIYGLGNHRSIR